MWAEYIDDVITPNFEPCVVHDDGDVDHRRYNELIYGLVDLFKQKDIDDAFIMGDKMTVLDIMVFPWVCRLPALKRLREWTWNLPVGYTRSKLEKWEESMMSVPAVRKTMPNHDRLLDMWKQMEADGRYNYNDRPGDLVRTPPTFPEFKEDKSWHEQELAEIKRDRQRLGLKTHPSFYNTDTLRDDNINTVRTSEKSVERPIPEETDIYAGLDDRHLEPEMDPELDPYDVPEEYVPDEKQTSRSRNPDRPSYVDKDREGEPLEEDIFEGTVFPHTISSLKPERF